MCIPTEPSSWLAIATFVLVGVTAYYAIQTRNTVKEMRNARVLEANAQLFAEMDKEDFRKARRFVYTELPSEPDEIKRDQLDQAEVVWVTMNRIAIMVEQAVIPKDLALQMYSDTVVRTWGRLATHIEYQRKRRNDPGYMKPFERLAGASKEYREKHFPGTEPAYFRED